MDEKKPVTVTLSAEDARLLAQVAKLQRARQLRRLAFLASVLLAATGLASLVAAVLIARGAL